MRNHTRWALPLVVMVVVACSSGTATPAPPASHAPTTAAPQSQAAQSQAAQSQAAATATAPSQETTVPQTPAASVNALPSVPTGYTELDQALDPSQPLKGKAVNIQVQWTGGELTNFTNSLAPFSAASGITINIDSVPSSHETVLRSRIEGGSPPDIAQLAQPSGVTAYAAEGKVIDLASFMDSTKLTSEHPSIAFLVQGDKIWGIPYKQDVKSMIWYPIKAFAAKGYTVPTTWDDLITLSDKIVADGSAPWCVSAGGPGDATGWQLTDWVEEVVLKSGGLDLYNQWINHTVKMDDPKIKDILDNYLGKILFTPGYVYNGYQSVVAQDQKTTMDPMFNQDLAAPQCWMQKIPTWYGPDFFPDQRVNGTPSKYTIGADGDIGIMPFPAVDASQNNVEVSGDTMMMLVDRPEVRAVTELLALPEGLQAWILAGSAISSNNKTPADWYAGSYKLQVASQIFNSATGAGFDASDIMPKEVGSGTFWTEMDAWVNGGGQNPTTDATLQAIDASWPTQ
ncbi:MAG TPA: ABC transporter substrate-binding protein [Candidatus Limnocylindrales bacterium]|jgi:alpha-glucoside transport system substrate-binding protein